MTEYLPYIFNIPSLILGLYLFVTSFKIYRPKHKTEEQTQTHLDHCPLRCGSGKWNAERGTKRREKLLSRTRRSEKNNHRPQ